MASYFLKASKSLAEFTIFTSLACLANSTASFNHCLPLDLTCSAWI